MIKFVVLTIFLVTLAVEPNYFPLMVAAGSIWSKFNA